MYTTDSFLGEKWESVQKWCAWMWKAYLPESLLLWASYPHDGNIIAGKMVLHWGSRGYGCGLLGSSNGEVCPVLMMLDITIFWLAGCVLIAGLMCSVGKLANLTTGALFSMSSSMSWGRVADRLWALPTLLVHRVQDEWTHVELYGKQNHCSRIYLGPITSGASRHLAKKVFGVCTLVFSHRGKAVWMPSSFWKGLR